MYADGFSFASFNLRWLRLNAEKKKNRHGLWVQVRGRMRWQSRARESALLLQKQKRNALVVLSTSVGEKLVVNDNSAIRGECLCFVLFFNLKGKLRGCRSNRVCLLAAGELDRIHEVHP